MYIPASELKEANEPLVGKFEGIGVQFNIFEDATRDEVEELLLAAFELSERGEASERPSINSGYYKHGEHSKNAEAELHTDLADLERADSVTEYHGDGADGRARSHAQGGPDATTGAGRRRPLALR